MALSAGFQTALETGGYVVEYYGELYDRTGVKTATVEVLSGSVDSSWMDATRRTAEFVVPLNGWTSSGNTTGGLVPESGFVEIERTFGEGTYGDDFYGFGLEIRDVIIGILKPFQTRVKLIARFTVGGQSEEVLLAFLTISSVSFVDDETGFTARVSAWDTAGDIQKRRFTEPVIIPATTNVTPALHYILDNYIPTGITETIPTITGDYTPALTYLPGDGRSPWEAAREVAMGANYLLTTERDGTITAVAIPQDVADYPAASWSLSDSATIARQESAPDYASVVNQVIVLGENASTSPVYGTATDNAGPFGVITTGIVVAREEVSDTCGTVGQCTNLANSLLRKWGRLADSFTAECVLNPDLDPGDVITVKSLGLGLNNVDLVVDWVRYPLSADAFMQVGCSQVT